MYTDVVTGAASAYICTVYRVKGVNEGTRGGIMILIMMIVYIILYIIKTNSLLYCLAYFYECIWLVCIHYAVESRMLCCNCYAVIVLRYINPVMYTMLYDVCTHLVVEISNDENVYRLIVIHVTRSLVSD